MTNHGRSIATAFAHAYEGAANLMDALKAAGVPSEQDWENGHTTWLFTDGSTITISGALVEVAEVSSAHRA